jgi:hypothetical protein
MGNARVKADLRTLCDAVNEWFPSWEFIGASLSVEDLLEWEVIRPEWVFGGRSPRTRALPVAAAKIQGRAAQKRHSKALETAPTKTNADPLPSTEGGEKGPSTQNGH